MKIFLLGMMGSGKSHWTTFLSKKLKTGGYDLDFLVESHEEKTIAEIFETDGETYFRQAETKILRWFAQKKAFVLATGGGTPCFNGNMPWMNKHGITIWIDEPVDVLAERLKPQKAHRPLISHLSDDELHRFLEQQLAERIATYQQAAHRVSGNDINASTFTKMLKRYA